MDFQYTVAPEDEGLTLNGILRRRSDLSGRTRTKLKQRGGIFLNGKPTPGGTVPRVGDVVTVELPEEKSNFLPQNIPVHPVYEDEHLLIVNKQPGIVVHPTPGQPDHTLANGLMQYMEDTRQSFKLRFVNRLDMDTSGLLIVAKTARVQADIMAQMGENTTEKRYRAIVHGVVVEDSFTIDLPIGHPHQDSPRRAVMEEGGAPSVTHVRVLERFPAHTLVELLLETGRTHQIRVHLSHLGHPLVGDSLYGGDTALLGRQALHACRLTIRHPATGERLTVEAPVPADMEGLLNSLRT